MELEEYEYDIVWSQEKRLWVTTLTTGSYLINVKAKGFKEINSVIHINSNTPTFYDFQMIKQVQANQISIKIQTFCATDGDSIPNVYLQLQKENLQQPEEGLTDNDGKTVLKFKDIGIHYIRAEKQGYLPLVKKINLTKDFIEKGYNHISIPLIKDDLEDD